ncbi:MAG TPA: FAD-binding oxidoreductase, partial [Kiloniellales bacterium]|nr:FAD-binding oxidoreductase [Kiloniellales bacterium]
MAEAQSRTRATEDLLGRLAEILGDKGLVTDPRDMAPHLVEPRGLYRGKALAIARPASTEEVAAVVALCAETGTPIVPQGGNTGLVGGGTPYEDGEALIVSLARMNRIRELDALNDTITVEAGCVLETIQEAASEADR